MLTDNNRLSIDVQNLYTVDNTSYVSYALPNAHQQRCARL